MNNGWFCKKCNTLLKVKNDPNHVCKKEKPTKCPKFDECDIGKVCKNIGIDCIMFEVKKFSVYCDSIESKYEVFWNFYRDVRNPLREGTIFFNKEGLDLDGGINYWVFPIEVSNIEVIEALESIGVNTDGVSIGKPYDCTGEYFSHRLEIIRKGSRVLAKQQWGYDV